MEGGSGMLLSLDNPVLPAEMLLLRPSARDGLGAEDETDLRILACTFMQQAGVVLSVPQVRGLVAKGLADGAHPLGVQPTVATACTLFHRFSYKRSLVKHEWMHVAGACIFLASKITEARRRLREIINTFWFLKQHHLGTVHRPLDSTRIVYNSLRVGFIKAERRILYELGFCVHVQHPHKHIVSYLGLLQSDAAMGLAQR
jgi:cyclin L